MKNVTTAKDIGYTDRVCICSGTGLTSRFFSKTSEVCFSISWWVTRKSYPQSVDFVISHCSPWFSASSITRIYISSCIFFSDVDTYNAFHLGDMVRPNSIEYIRCQFTYRSCMALKLWTITGIRFPKHFAASAYHSVKIELDHIWAQVDFIYLAQPDLYNCLLNFFDIRLGLLFKK